MKIVRSAAAIACVLFAAIDIPAQILPGPAPASLLRSLDLNNGMVQQIAVPDEPGAGFETEVWLDGNRETLALVARDVRTSDFVLRVADAGGVRTVATPASVVYRGDVRGRQGSVVAATVRNGRLRAVVHASARNVFGIQPIDPAVAGRNDLYVVYHTRDLTALDVHCGVTDEPVAGGPEVAFSGATTQVVEIACEADFAFFQKNGSDVNATHDDVLLVMAGCDVIYERDTDIQVRVKSILVRTATDPYTSTNSSTLLNEFRTWWNANQSTQSDLAHLFTGRNLDGNVIGVAFLGVVCSSFSSYGLSESRFTSNLVSRIGLTAHELGHNWNAGHCDGANPCWIMCPGIGGCDRDVTAFAPSSITAITNHKNSRSCLSSPAVPVLTTLTPAAVDVLASPQITLFGDELQFATAINFGGQVLTPSSFQVLDNHTIQMLPPTPSAFGSVAVSVTTPSGTTNALTLTYGAVDPARLVAPTNPPAGSTMTWAFGAQPSDFYYLVVSVDSGATVPVLGKPALFSFFVLKQGRLDALGLGRFNFGLPPQIAGLVFHSQVAVIDDQTLGLADVSNIVRSAVGSAN